MKFFGKRKTSGTSGQPDSGNPSKEATTQKAAPSTSGGETHTPTNEGKSQKASPQPKAKSPEGEASSKPNSSPAKPNESPPEKSESPSHSAGNTETPNTQQGGEEDNDSGKTQGMISSEKAVKFVNKTVLNSKVQGMQGSSKTLADQASAMMIQDMRAFVQGNEQLITAGMGKAIALMVDPATTEKGVKAAEALTKVMQDLSKFATTIGTSASSVMTSFDKAS